jgi:hypothetical protein
MSPTAAQGPVVTFFGLTNQDDTLLPASGTNPDGITVFSPLNGKGFSIVVEGAPGPSGAAVGLCTFGVYNPTNDSCTPSCAPGCTNFPDLQIEASSPLGNGSPAVCDGNTGGGVPGVFPTTFDPTIDPNIFNIVNDLACRFLDGNGAQRGRTTYPCVKDEQSQEYGFADPRSTTEFCGEITPVEQFPPSTDTKLTVRLRDVNGAVGAPAQIVVHAGP